MPVALVDTYMPGAELPAVVPDYRDGARLATEHLLGLGYRRVALLGAAVTYQGKATLREGQLFPRSDEILKRAVHVDLHPLLSDGDVDDVSVAVHKVAQAIL